MVPQNTVKSTKSSALEVNLSSSTFIFQIFGLQQFSFCRRSFFTVIDKLLMHKIIFISIILALVAEVIGIVNIILEEKKHRNSAKVSQGLVFQFGTYSYMIISVFVTVGHSLKTKKKAKDIFGNLAKISKIFKDRLDYDVNYRDALIKFNYHTKLVSFIFLLASAMTIGFIFYFMHQPTTLYWALISIFPYSFILLSFWKFSFYIQLVHVNLKSIKNVLQRTLDAKNIFYAKEIIFKVQTKSNQDTNIFYIVMHLKQIYMMLYETVGLVNSVCGVGILIQLILSVVGDISAGYKFYLLIMGQLPIERIGGKKLKLNVK